MNKTQEIKFTKYDWVNEKDKRDSEFGEYYLKSKKGGESYSGEVGFIYFRLIFEGVTKHCFMETYLSMKDNILIKIFFPVRTALNLSKNGNMIKFFGMKEIYDSLPKEYRWWRMDEDGIKDTILKRLKLELKKIKVGK